MENKARNIIAIIFEKIYYYLTFSIMFTISMVGGLVVGSFAGSHIMAYEIYNKLARERYKEKVKVTKIFRENIVNVVIDNIKISLLFVFIIIVLLADLFYFSTAISPIFTGLFYITLVLSFVVINAIILSFYIMASFKDMAFREVIQNAISLVVVNLIDVLLLDIVVGLVLYFLGKISIILVLLLGPGIYIELSHIFFTRMVDEKSISYLLFNIKSFEHPDA